MSDEAERDALAAQVAALASLLDRWQRYGPYENTYADTELAIADIPAAGRALLDAKAGSELRLADALARIETLRHDGDELRARLKALSFGGHVWIECARDVNGGPYWTVAGGDVQAGGYETFEDALDAWIQHRADAAPEEEKR
ncbi:MAG: hypothetical protein KGL35_06465 [Bradyrhizobium sp.]|nr:hypothetical protein [Bradyrhizobium sp.]